MRPLINTMNGITYRKLGYELGPPKLMAMDPGDRRRAGDGGINCGGKQPMLVQAGREEKRLVLCAALPFSPSALGMEL